MTRLERLDSAGHISRFYAGHCPGWCLNVRVFLCGSEKKLKVRHYCPESLDAVTYRPCYNPLPLITPWCSSSKTHESFVESCPVNALTTRRQMAVSIQIRSPTCRARSLRHIG